MKELFDMIDRYNELEDLTSRQTASTGGNVAWGHDPNDNTKSELRKAREIPLTDKEREFARADFARFKEEMKKYKKL